MSVRSITVAAARFMLHLDSFGTIVKRAAEPALVPDRFEHLEAIRTFIGVSEKQTSHSKDAFVPCLRLIQ